MSHLVQAILNVTSNVFICISICVYLAIYSLLGPVKVRNEEEIKQPVTLMACLKQCSTDSAAAPTKTQQISNNVSQNNYQSNIVLLLLFV